MDVMRVRLRWADSAVILILLFSSLRQIILRLSFDAMETRPKHDSRPFITLLGVCSVLFICLSLKLAVLTIHVIQEEKKNTEYLDTIKRVRTTIIRESLNWNLWLKKKSKKHTDILDILAKICVRW